MLFAGIPQNCAKIPEHNLFLFPGSLCEFGTASLTIKLSENSTINSGDNIIFKPWNNIREHLSGQTIEIIP